MHCNRTGSVIDLDIELCTLKVCTIDKKRFAVLNTLIRILYCSYHYTAIVLSLGHLDVIVTAPAGPLTVQGTQCTGTRVSLHNYIWYVQVHPANDYIV